MRLHPKGSMGNRRTNRSASSKSLPCVLVYRWSSYFPSSPERPASLMAFDQPEIWRDTNDSECDIRLDNTKRRITQSQFRWSRPAQHSWPAERPTSARPHRLPQPANVRQQRPGPCPCYCVGTSSRLVAGRSGVTTVDVRADAAVQSYSSADRPRQGTFCFDEKYRCVSRHVMSRRIEHFLMFVPKQGTTHERAIQT